MKKSNPIKQNPNTSIILCSLMYSLLSPDSGWKYVQIFILQAYFAQQEPCQTCSSSFLLLGFQSGIQTQLSFCQCRERFPNSEQEFLCRKQGAALSQSCTLKSCPWELKHSEFNVFPTLKLFLTPKCGVQGHSHSFPSREGWKIWGVSKKVKTTPKHQKLQEKSQ